MDEHELNKKLAVWRGFALIEWQRQVSGTVQPWVSLRYPDNTYHDRNDIPNFTQSSDVCFKWLVPEVSKTNEVRITIPPGSSNRFLVGIGHQENIGAETFALALCLAIEKLIDKEVKQ